MDMNLFFKENQKQKENVKYAATKSLCDEQGKPLEWEFRHISSREMNEIQDRHTYEVQVTGKPGMYRPKVDSAKVNLSMICEATVWPDLNNAALMDSYGVMTPEELLLEMVNDPGEYTNLLKFVSELNGFNMQQEIETAKNS